MIGVVQTLPARRAAINVLLAAYAAIVVRHALPLPAEHPLFRFFAFIRPGLYAMISYGHAAPWASTTFVALPVATSVLCIVFARIEAADAGGATALSEHQPTPRVVSRCGRAAPPSREQIAACVQLVTALRAISLSERTARRSHFDSVEVLERLKASFAALTASHGDRPLRGLDPPCALPKPANMGAAQNLYTDASFN